MHLKATLDLVHKAFKRVGWSVWEWITEKILIVIDLLEIEY